MKDIPVIWCSERQNQYTQSQLTENSLALSANQQVSHSTPSCSAVGLFDAEPSEPGRIYILPVHQQFQPTSMPARYPGHNDFYGVEQDFLLFLQNHKELITHDWQEAKWHYLPVFWTHWLVSHDYGKRDLDKLQHEVNRCILDDSRTFTICQYADGPLVDIGLSSVFLSSRNTERGIDIPCLCAPHKKPSRLPVKKYLASFVGRLSTGEVRRQMAENLKGHSDILITDRSEGTDYFAQTMLESYIALSPRGYGGGSFRFYEAMQLGTVPFLIGNIDTRAFKDFINWDEVSFYAPDACDIAVRLRRMNKQQLLEMGAKAAKVWAEELSYQNWCRYVIKELQSHSDPITGFKVHTGMSHFLSFIIPCYNCADTVGEAIESIYQQNLDIPFEVVCTDDGSEDSTREVLSYYQNKHSNLNVHYHDQNMGVYGGAAAANTCVANSKGDLIFRLDSDNILVPDSVSKLIKLLDKTGCDGAAFAELRYFEGSKGNYRHSHSWFYEAPNNICDISHILSTSRTPAASGNYLYTRKSFDRVGGYPNVGLDSLGFGFRQHATGGEIVILPGTFYWHRLSANSCWVHDEKRGVNGKYGATIFREFPELFTDETNSFLASPDCEKDFFKHLKSGRFKAVPKQSLAYLFQGYREQLDRKYSEAVNSFSRAISFGCKHWKVVWCLSQAAYNAGNMNLAKQAVEAVTELVPNFIEAKDLLQQIGCKPERQTKPRVGRTAGNQVKTIDNNGDVLRQIKEFGLWNEGKPLRLHLGCGQNHFDGYINIDYPPSEHNLIRVKADIYADIKSLDFPSESVDEVRLHHVFEHFNRVTALAMLIKWHKWLKIGGRIHIETPDLIGSAKTLVSNASWKTKMGVARHLAGDQAANWGYHVDHWFGERFERTLGALGFKSIQTWSTSWTKEPYLANAKVTAVKTRGNSLQQQLKAAEKLLWESTVSLEERSKWEVWKKQLHAVLAGDFVASPSNTQTPDVSSVLAAPTILSQNSSQLPLDEIHGFNQRSRNRWVQAKARTVPAGSRVLDVGAGTCPYRSFFKHCDYKTHDFKKYKGIKKNNTTEYGQIDYISDITNIPVPDGSFDVIICTEVLEHVPEPIEALREMARILKRGGSIFVTAPLGSGLHQLPYHYYGGLSPQWYRYFFPKFGLQLKEISPNGGFFKLLAQECTRVQWTLPQHQHLHGNNIEFIRHLFGEWLPRYLFALEEKCFIDQFTVGYHVEATKNTDVHSINNTAIPEEIRIKDVQSVRKHAMEIRGKTDFFVDELYDNGFDWNLWRKKILFLTVGCINYDCNINFYEPLKQIFSNVINYNYIEKIKQIGKESMNAEIIEVARKERPDYVLLHTYQDQVELETLDAIGALGIKVIAWFSDDHWRFENYSKIIAKHVFCSVTTDKHSVEKYIKSGFNIIRSQWASNQDYYQKTKSKFVYDVSFVGQNYGKRQENLLYLKNSGVPVAVFGRRFGKFLEFNDIIKIFNASKINLNFSGSSSNDYIKQIKGRVFEVPMCGGFLLTEYVDGIEDYYEIGKEIECFESITEAVEKISYYLKNNDKRMEIANSGHYRALREHTWVKRLKGIFDEVNKIQLGQQNIDYTPLSQEKKVIKPVVNISHSIGEKQKKRVLLTTSAAPTQSPFSTSEKRPPIGVGFLISVLRNAGHEVFFIDNYLQPTNFLETDWLQKNQIDFVGIYANTICFRDTLRMMHKLEHLRQTGGWKGRIIVGGPHTTVAVHTIPDFVDYVVQGEGEHAILDIVEDKVTQRIVSYPRIKNLDELPMPAWHYFVELPYNWGMNFLPETPVFTMNTSRGCPFKCEFCSVGSIWGKKYTYFSAERIVADIEYLIKHYGVKGVYFREDNFTLNKERLKKFCNLIIEKGIKVSWACESRVSNLDRDIIELMSRAGLKGFYFGVESGSQRMLNLLQKGITVEQIRNAFCWCHEFGVKAIASTIVGVPGETQSDRQETKQLLKEINPDATWFNVFVGIPNSKLYRFALENKLYEYIDDRGLVYLQGHNDRAQRYYKGGFNACIPFEEEKKDITNKPKISVLISVHNTEQFIEEALKSIYNQTYQDFEVVIVDDCSTDRTSEILLNLKDSRTCIYRNPENLGLTKSLNIGLKLCRGQYVARMDADDISHPQRFERQVKFLDENPDCLVLGCWYGLIDSDGKILGSKEPPTEYEDTKKQLLIEACVGHGTAIVRRAALVEVGGYNEQYTYAQDYDLWLRLSEVGLIRNLDEYLYLLRSWPGNITTIKLKEQTEFAELAIRQALQRRYGNGPIDREVSYGFVKRAITWFNLREYVNCINTLNNTQKMAPNITKRFKGYDLLLALAYFAIGREQQCLTCLRREIQNHNNPAAGKFLSDYFEKNLRMDVQNWCSQNSRHYNLQLVDLEKESCQQRQNNNISEPYVSKQQSEQKGIRQSLTGPAVLYQGKGETARAPSSLEKILSTRHDFGWAKDMLPDAARQSSSTESQTGRQKILFYFDRIGNLNETSPAGTVIAVLNFARALQSSNPDIKVHITGDFVRYLEKYESFQVVPLPNAEERGKFLTDYDVVFFATHIRYFQGLTKPSGQIWVLYQHCWEAGDYVSLSHTSDFDIVICLSELHRASLREQHIGNEKLITIPNLIDTNVYSPGYIHRNNHSIMFAGGLHPHKCIHILLDAFRLVRQQVQDAELHIYGDGQMWRGGDDYGNYLKGIKPEGVHFHGYVSNKDMPQIYSKHSILCLPSKLETFPMVIVEAQACGCIPVAHNAGGVTATLADEQTGLLYSPNTPEKLAETIIKAIKIVDADPSVRQKAINFVRNTFSINRAAEYISKLWDKINIAKKVNTIRTLLKDNEIEQADLKCKELLQEYPNDPDVLLSQALVMLQQGNKPKANVAIGKLLENFPNHLRALNDFGLTAMKAGDTEKALRYLTKAYKFNPWDKDTITNCYAMLTTSGKYRDAKMLLLNYLTNVGEDAQVLQLFSEIDNLIANAGSGTKVVSKEVLNNRQDVYCGSNTSMPLVSIITPVYNGADYIGQTIESVLTQDYPNFELVIIDDGSTDNTKEVILRYNDGRIRYLYQENKGVSSARNLAIKKAKGQYIMPLDADDMMTPDFIVKHLAEFEKYPEVDLVYCDVLLIDGNSKPIRIMNKPEYQDRRHLIRDLFRAGHPIIPFRFGIKRSVFDKIGFYDEDLLIGEDYDMMRRFVKAGLKAHHLSEPLHLRRIYADSLSRNCSAQKAKSHFDVVKRFTDTFTYDELFPDIEWDKIAPQMRQLHAKCLAAGNYLAIGQGYVKTNAAECSRIAFDLACSELNDCVKMDPKNQGLRQLLQKSKLIRAKYTEAPQQVVS